MEEPVVQLCRGLYVEGMWRLLNFPHFWGDVGTRTSSGVPASFNVPFQDKAGNTGSIPAILGVIITTANCCRLDTTDFCYSAWDSQSSLQKHYTLTAVTEVSQNTRQNSAKYSEKSKPKWFKWSCPNQWSFFLSFFFASMLCLIKGNNVTSPLDCYDIIIYLWSVWIA